jgi:hypothetical protein
MQASIAQTIIAAAKNNHSILNWDGQTSKADLLENIRHYVSRFTGYKKLAVTFENGKLEIHAETTYTPHQEWDSMLPPPEPMADYTHLLSYNVATGREIYGRLRGVGFYYPHLAELEVLLTAQ